MEIHGNCAMSGMLLWFPAQKDHATKTDPGTGYGTMEWGNEFTNEAKYVSFITGNSPDESISFIPISPTVILAAGSLIRRLLNGNPFIASQNLTPTTSERKGSPCMQTIKAAGIIPAAFPFPILTSQYAFKDNLAVISFVSFTSH